MPPTHECTMTTILTNVEDSVRIYVLTATFQNFRDWCHSHGLSPRDGHRVRWLADPMQCRGLRADSGHLFVKGPRYDEHPKAAAIMGIMMANGFEAIYDVN